MKLTEKEITLKLLELNSKVYEIKQKIIYDQDSQKQKELILELIELFDFEDLREFRFLLDEYSLRNEYWNISIMSNKNAFTLYIDRIEEEKDIFYIFQTISMFIYKLSEIYELKSKFKNLNNVNNVKNLIMYNLTQEKDWFFLSYSVLGIYIENCIYILILEDNKWSVYLTNSYNKDIKIPHNQLIKEVNDSDYKNEDIYNEKFIYSILDDLLKIERDEILKLREGR